MGTERKAITFKAIAENEAWLEAEVTRLNAALAPLEVRKSGLLNALVSMARTQQIQLPLSFVQGKPSKPGLPSTPEVASESALVAPASNEVRPHGTVTCGGAPPALEAADRQTSSSGIRQMAGNRKQPDQNGSDAALPQKSVRRRAERMA